MARKISKADQAEALKNLREWLSEGQRIYTILRHRSASGMSRVIDCYIIEDNRPMRITWSVAAALGYTYDTKYEGVKIAGCGMDMGVDLVQHLSHAVFNRDEGTYSFDKSIVLKQEWL